MKCAKEYAKQYEDKPTDETLAKIAVAFLVEVAELAEMRHLGKQPSNSAALAIFDKQDRKWRTFAENFPSIIRPNGFELLVKDKLPSFYIVWRGPLAKAAKKWSDSTKGVRPA